MKLYHNFPVPVFPGSVNAYRKKCYDAYRLGLSVSLYLHMHQGTLSTAGKSSLPNDTHFYRALCIVLFKRATNYCLARSQLGNVTFPNLVFSAGRRRECVCVCVCVCFPKMFLPQMPMYKWTSLYLRSLVLN